MTPRFPRKPALRRLFVLALVLSLAACVTPPPPPSVPAPPAELPPSAAALAERLESEGQFVVAAREYTRLADATRPPARQNFLLNAVGALIKAGELREARHRLAQVDVTGLDPSLGARKRVLEARLLMQAGAHEKAVRILNDSLAARGLNPALTAEILAARAEAELALNNPFGAARNLIQREQYIAGKDAVTDNQLRLWKLLESQARQQLALELDQTRDPLLAGWIELAIAAVDFANNAAGMELAIERWKKAYPRHPAGETILASLVSKAPKLASRFEQIALLLPLTSPHGVAAAAVRDGFLAMHKTRTGDRPETEVKVYDIGDDVTQAPAFYEQAVRDGARLVVGPLGREATDAIVKKGNLTVPTLLLSHTDESVAGAGRYVFQFGLPPEQEARQAAERAYLDGHRQAAVLYPANPWGERMRSAFIAHWQELGGIVLASESYESRQGDYSDSIKRLLNIVHSEARRDQLAARLKQKLQFDVRARQDIDFIFLAADARRGRLLKPQLNFYRASRIPVYATSHIYTGKGDPVHDVDLDGVLFADMPWMLMTEGNIQTLRDSLQRDWPHAQTDLDRLYALGVDSYAVVPHLSRISTDLTARFGGVTSVLSLDPQGRLRRQMTWAQFKKGVPRLVDAYQKYRGHLEVEGGG